MVQQLFVIMNNSINKKKQTSLLNHAQQISKTINDMDKLLLHPELRDIPFSNLLLHSTIIASANVRDDYERDAIRDLQKMPSIDLKDKTRGEI